MSFFRAIHVRDVVDPDTYTFTFVNANLQERHDISVPISEASSYFWIAGGKGLAFLPTDRTSVHLVDTTTGQVTNYPVTETGTGCITQYIEHLWANNRPPTSETFSCQPTNGDCCNLESGDGPQYDQDFEEVDNRVVAVSVTNRQTGQTRRIEFADPTEDMYAIVLSSPPSDLSKLAVLQGKLVDPSILDTRWRYSTPGDRVVVFDLATGRQIAAFEGNYATLSWSPDKSQILTQLGSQICVLHVADHISHCSETTDSDLARVSLLRWSANGKQIYFVQNAKRADLCVIDVASDDVFCPTAGLKELDTLNVESYRVSLDEEFFIFSYGSSCADCDYWGEPSSAIIRKDGTDFFLLGEEVYDPQSTFGPYPYGSITMRPNK